MRFPVLEASTEEEERGTQSSAGVKTPVSDHVTLMVEPSRRDPVSAAARPQDCPVARAPLDMVQLPKSSFHQSRPISVPVFPRNPVCRTFPGFLWCLMAVRGSIFHSYPYST